MICLYPIQLTYTSRRRLIKYEVCPDISSSRTRLFRTKYFTYNIKSSLSFYYILKYKEQYLGEIISSWTFLTSKKESLFTSKGREPFTRRLSVTYYQKNGLFTVHIEFIYWPLSTVSLSHACAFSCYLSYFCHDV